MNSGKHAADEVDAGRDHRRGVDEGGDGRRAFHRVGQPDVQRELRRLADAAEEDAQARDDEQPVRHDAVVDVIGRCGDVEATSLCGRDRAVEVLGMVPGIGNRARGSRCGAVAGGSSNCRPSSALGRGLTRTICSQAVLAVRVLSGRGRAEHLLEVERAEVGPDDQQADDEAGVADAVDDERLVRRVAGARPLVVEADQEERADADQLPADEHLEQVVREHQVEHREAEQRQVQEEPAEPAAAVKVVRPSRRARSCRSTSWSSTVSSASSPHVAEREDEDERGDERDHHEHDGREVSMLVADFERQRPVAAACSGSSAWMRSNSAGVGASAPIVTQSMRSAAARCSDRSRAVASVRCRTSPTIAEQPPPKADERRSRRRRRS